MKKQILILFSALLLSVSTYAIAEDKKEEAKTEAKAEEVKTEAKAEEKPAAAESVAQKVKVNANDPFAKWYKPGTQLISVPSTYGDSARDLVKVIRNEFKKQINSLPESEWKSTRQLTGNKTNQEIDAVLKVKLSPDNDTGNKADIDNANGARDFEHGADAATYKLGSCAWHFYFLSMQTKDDKTRVYTEASTKVLISAATAINTFAAQYDTDSKKFDSDRNDKAIWQALQDTEVLVFKMADATKDKQEDEVKKYKAVFDAGTKKCQAEAAQLAAMVLIKANNK